MLTKLAGLLAISVFVKLEHLVLKMKIHLTFANNTYFLLSFFYQQCYFKNNELSLYLYWEDNYFNISLI